ncbi:TonB-dependent receptor domain-containing protein [Variovorax sp. LARHSF232]
MLPVSLAVATLLSLIGPAAAQSASAAIESPSLQPVVVTASQREQAVRNAPASVTVITRQEIEQRTETSVTELLRTVEGVSIVGANPNDTDISLRGMPGDYTLLLVDGKRLNTRETMNRGSGGVQANLLPPLAAIERIEVVRGPMSSIYGADALGGVVNIITRKLPQRWSGTVAANVVKQQHDELGDSRGAEFWLGGPLVDDTLGLQISGVAKKRDEDDVFFPANVTSGANGQRNEQLDLKLSARLAANQDLTMNLGRQELDYLTTPGLSIADLATAATVRKTRHGRDYWGLTHDGRWNWGRSTVSMYGDTGTQTQWTAAGESTVEPKLRTTTLDGHVVIPWAKDKNTLTLGAQAIKQRLDGVAAQDAVPNGLPVNPNLLDRNSWAVYAENDFAITDAFTLTAGLRSDNDDTYGNHLSPRLYGVYQIDSAWTLRGGVATGFKAPTLRQTTPGYCMTTGGAAGATPGTLCGNPELDPETSVTGEIGLRWERQDNYAGLTVFDNRIKNRVASYDTGVADRRVRGRNVYVYDNIAQVDISGLEFAASHAIGPGLRLSGNYTYTDSRRKGGGETAFNGSSLDGQPLDKTPRNMANLRLDWKALQSLDLYAALYYTGKQYWAAFRNGALGVREREAATTLDLGGRYALAKGLDLKFAVLNVTDKRVDVDTRARTAGLDGNWMVDEGRRYALSLVAQF